MTLTWLLAGKGVFWLAATLIAYAGARALQKRLGGTPIANSVLIATAPLIAILVASNTSYADYSIGGSVLLWLLGPATVALAVPLYRNFSEVRGALVPLSVALVVCSLVAVISAIGIAYAMGASPETIRSLAPKSVTTPIAMGIAVEIGGVPELTAAFVIITGIVGAVFASAVFNFIGIRDARARGFATGVVAGGIGTARAFQESFLSGTFSGIGMTLNGIVTAILLPLLWLAFS